MMQGWATPGVKIPKKNWAYDVSGGGWSPPGHEPNPQGTQATLPDDFSYDPDQTGFHTILSPAGTPAPADLINYTPATGQVHAAGAQAPEEFDNLSLFPARRDANGQQQAYGIGQSVGTGQAGPVVGTGQTAPTLDQVTGASNGSPGDGPGTDSLKDRQGNIIPGYIVVTTEDGIQHVMADPRIKPQDQATMTHLTGNTYVRVGQDGRPIGEPFQLGPDPQSTAQPKSLQVTKIGNEYVMLDPANGAMYNPVTMAPLNAAAQSGARPGAPGQVGQQIAQQQQPSQTPQGQQQGTQPEGGGAGRQFSPYDAIFQKYAGDLGNDPEFMAIVAASTYAESGWNPAIAGDGGDSVGLFQINKVHGLPDSIRTDPDASAKFMMPQFVAAYKQGQAMGLSGRKLAEYVGGTAEGSQPQYHYRYGDAYDQIQRGEMPSGDYGYPGGGGGYRGSGGSTGSLGGLAVPDTSDHFQTVQAGGRTFIMDQRSGKIVSEVQGNAQTATVGSRLLERGQNGTWQVAYQAPNDMTLKEEGNYLLGVDPETGHSTVLFEKPAQWQDTAGGLIVPNGAQVTIHDANGGTRVLGNNPKPLPQVGQEFGPPAAKPFQPPAPAPKQPSQTAVQPNGSSASPANAPRGVVNDVYRATPQAQAPARPAGQPGMPAPAPGHYVPERPHDASSDSRLAPKPTPPAGPSPFDLPEQRPTPVTNDGKPMSPWDIDEQDQRDQYSTSQHDDEVDRGAQSRTDTFNDPIGGIDPALWNDNVYRGGGTTMQPIPLSPPRDSNKPFLDSSDWQTMGSGQGVGQGQSAGGAAQNPGGWTPPVDPSQIVGGGNKWGQQVSMEGVHHGTDLQAYEGTPALSPVDGTIVGIDNDPEGLGLQVHVRDAMGQVHTLAHLLDAKVQEGQSVKAGTPVGQVGASGAGATGPHLDYRIQDAQGQYENPEPLLGPLGHLPEAPNTVGEGQESVPPDTQWPRFVPPSRPQPEYAERDRWGEDPDAQYPITSRTETFDRPTERDDWSGAPMPPQWGTDYSQDSNVGELGAPEDRWPQRSLPQARLGQGQNVVDPTMDDDPQTLVGDGQGAPSRNREHMVHDAQAWEPWTTDQQVGTGEDGWNYDWGLAGGTDSKPLWYPQDNSGGNNASGGNSGGGGDNNNTAEMGLNPWQQAQYDQKNQELANQGRQIDGQIAAEKMQHQANMATAQNYAAQQKETARHNKAMEAFQQQQLAVQVQQQGLDRQLQLATQGTFGSRSQLDLMKGALSNPWLQNLTGMTPGFGKPGWSAQTGGGVLGDLFKGWRPPPAFDFQGQAMQAIGANGQQPAAQAGGPTAQSPQSVFDQSGFNQAKQTWKQGGKVGNKPSRGDYTTQQAIAAATGGGNPVGQQLAANTGANNAGWGGYAPIGGTPPEPKADQFQSMSPFEQAAYRTTAEAAQPWAATQNQLQQDWASQGVTQAPKTTALQAAAGGPLGMQGRQNLADVLGNSPQQYWTDQQKTWSKAQAPQVNPWS